MAKKTRVLEWTITAKVQTPADAPDQIEKTLAPIRKVIAAAGGTMKPPSARTRSLAAVTPTPETVAQTTAAAAE